MKTIKILHMYSNILDLYGDSGNIEVLRYRCRMRNIECIVEYHSLGTKDTDFSKYDLIYLGGGADFEQQLLGDDLLKCKEAIKSAYEDGAFLLLICGGYQHMGQYYIDSNKEKIPGLGLFDYYTVASSDKGKRCIGNIIVEAELNGEKTKVIGFENHGGQTSNINAPFGKVLFGNGNCFNDNSEGYFEKNVIATYLHGPLLSKNPKIADYIIEYCINRNSNDKVKLAEINDSLELKCREVLFERLLK